MDGMIDYIQAYLAQVTLQGFTNFIFALFAMMVISFIVTLAFYAVSRWFIPTVKP